MVSSLIFIGLTMCLSSPGSLIQTSQSLEHRRRNHYALDILSSQVIALPDSGRDSLEGFGQSVYSTASQTFVSRPVTPKKPQPSLSKQFGSGITFKAIVPEIFFKMAICPAIDCYTTSYTL